MWHVGSNVKYLITSLGNFERLSLALAIIQRSYNIIPPYHTSCIYLYPYLHISIYIYFFQMSINIIQKAFTANRKESVSRHDTSPVKTVLGSDHLHIVM